MSPQIKPPPEMLMDIIGLVRVHASRETREWFFAGTEAWLTNASRLDVALGLRTQASNARTPLRAWQHEKRDEHIRRAVQHCTGPRDFLLRLAAFENSSAWQQHKHRQHPPKNWPPLDKSLFNVLSNRVPVPRTCRRIEQIVARETSSRSGFADALSLLSSHDKKMRRKPR